MYLLEDIRCIRGRGRDAFHVSLPLLQLEAGQTLAITGHSGCGKSTVLEVLGLVLRPAGSGLFLWQSQSDSVDIEQLWQQEDTSSLARLRSRHIGFVLQTGGLLPYLTVEANIRLARQIAGLDSALPWIEEMVERLQLTRLLHKHPRSLSVGERQRASIARAMAHEPQLLLADEPTAALDPQLAGQVLELMLSLVARCGSSAVIVSHDHEWLQQRVDLQLRAEPFRETSGARGSVFV